MSNDSTTNTPDPAELADDALEAAAGGVIGTDTNGDGIIDGGCTDPFPGKPFPGTEPWVL